MLSTGIKLGLKVAFNVNKKLFFPGLELHVIFVTYLLSAEHWTVIDLTSIKSCFKKKTFLLAFELHISRVGQ